MVVVGLLLFPLQSFAGKLVKVMPNVKFLWNMLYVTLQVSTIKF